MKREFLEVPLSGRAIKLIRSDHQKVAPDASLLLSSGCYSLLDGTTACCKLMGEANNRGVIECL